MAKVRTWCERGAIVAAVLASIATSKTKSHATLPNDDPSTARLIVVEASSEPWVSTSGPGYLQPQDRATKWPGTARYLIPQGVAFAKVEVPAAGPVFSCCTEPEATVVRVVSSTAVATWKIETTSESVNSTLHPNELTVFRVAFDASLPPRVEIAGSPSHPSNIDVGDGVVEHVGDGVVEVRFPADPSRTTITWTLHATIEGACPDLKPCEPPAGARLSIGAVNR